MWKDEDSREILAKIITLYDHIDALNKKFPRPRHSRVDDIIEAFERRILVETKKLKDLKK
jgi:hypothetical protein